MKREIRAVVFIVVITAGFATAPSLRGQEAVPQILDSQLSSELCDLYRANLHGQAVPKLKNWIRKSSLQSYDEALISREVVKHLSRASRSLASNCETEAAVDAAREALSEAWSIKSPEARARALVTCGELMHDVVGDEVSEEAAFSEAASILPQDNTVIAGQERIEARYRLRKQLDAENTMLRQSRAN